MFIGCLLFSPNLFHFFNINIYNVAYDTLKAIFVVLNVPNLNIAIGYITETTTLK